MTIDKPFKLGIVARMDWGSGLASQTYNLVRMLQPDKVLVVDSTPFNDNKQRPEMYDGFNVDKVMGFPNIGQYMEWLKDLTHVLTAETFYNDRVVNFCLRHGIKTYIQPNYEFMDAMVRPMTAPTMYFVPSQWKLKEIQRSFPDSIYLPPPLFSNEFKEARKANFSPQGRRFLHIVGKWASKDRNGTKSLFEALQHTKEDFEIVVRSQSELDFWTDDKRVKLEIGNIDSQEDMYKGFDAMILPRRYGGLCLPMNEALMAGLPVIMTDISPNNQVLPEEWLVQAQVHDKLATRMVLDVYNADPYDLASTIDAMCVADLENAKLRAFELGMQYNADLLKPLYLKAME